MVTRRTTAGRARALPRLLAPTVPTSSGCFTAHVPRPRSACTAATWALTCDYLNTGAWCAAVWRCVLFVICLCGARAVGSMEGCACGLGTAGAAVVDLPVPVSMALGMEGPHPSRANTCAVCSYPPFDACPCRMCTLVLTACIVWCGACASAVVSQPLTCFRLCLRCPEHCALSTLGGLLSPVCCCAVWVVYHVPADGRGAYFAAYVRGFPMPLACA